MKKNLILILVLVLIFENKAFAGKWVQTNWSPWRPLNGQPGLDVSVKCQGYGPTYSWDIAYRNRYSKAISFSEGFGKFGSTIKLEGIAGIGAGKITKTWYVRNMPCGSKWTVRISKVTFGSVHRI